MGTWKEEDHPRAEDGKFTDGSGKTFRQNTPYKEISRELDVRKKIRAPRTAGKEMPLGRNGELDELRLDAEYRKLNEEQGKSVSPGTLSKKEWAMWYAAIGEAERGMYVPMIGGSKLISVGRKIIFTSGTYANPVVDEVKSFSSEEKADDFIEAVVKGGKRK